MRDVFSGGLVAAALGMALIVAGVFPVSAQVARPQSALATGADTNSDLLILVQRGERSGGGGGGGNVGGGGGGGGGGGVIVGRSGDGGSGLRSGGTTTLRSDRGKVVLPSGSERSVNVNRDRRGGSSQVTRLVRDRDGKRRRVIVHRFYNYPYWSLGLGYGVASYPGYCMSQFQAYDPVSGLYLGYDGLWYSCP